MWKLAGFAESRVLGLAAGRSWGSQNAATIIGLGRGLWLLPLDLVFRMVGLRYRWLRALFSAERAAWRATRQVPAYRDTAADPLAARGAAPRAAYLVGVSSFAIAAVLLRPVDPTRRDGDVRP